MSMLHYYDNTGCSRKKTQPFIWNYNEMLHVKLVYDNQLHNKHGFWMK